MHVNTVQVGGVALQLRTLVDRQQFWDPDGEAERAGISSSTWPLFGVVWPSGSVLADQMTRTPVAGLRVLEIGCGIAMASMVVQRRLGNITASDHHPLAPTFLLANLALNGLPPLPYAAGNWALHDAAFGEFDLIIGSDVLYEPAHPAMVAQFIQWHAAPQAQVIIVDPDRGNRSAFARGMAAIGFAQTVRRVTELPSGGGAWKGRVLSYQRALPE
ncbi:MAG: SAM-dependent methyltransferase [Pseudomonadota bacterium]